MAPPPPPYTREQIAALKSPTEKLRAMAELKSYIARLKQEKQDQEREAQHSEYYSGYSGGFGPQRGGHVRSRGSSIGYHPYGRAYPPAPFKNNTMMFTAPVTSKPQEAAVLSASSEHSRLGTRQQIRPKPLCPAFTMTGVCAWHGCSRVHDPEKQTVCRHFLRGNCTKGDACPLSHVSSPHNTPTCLHFQEGRCTKDDCRFAHILLNPAAHNCEAFGNTGYCEQGADCPELHARECPKFANTGSCPQGETCRLGHVHRASRMRKAAGRPSEGQSPSSDGLEDKIDDTAEAESWRSGATDQNLRQFGHFTQQDDFVPLTSED